MMATDATSHDTLRFPLPFASEPEGCLGLVSPSVYKDAFAAAGFDLVSEVNKLDFVTSALTDTLVRSSKYAKAHGGMPPLTLAVVMGPALREKMTNCLDLFRSGHMSASELIWVKPPL